MSIRKLVTSPDPTHLVSKTEIKEVLFLHQILQATITTAIYETIVFIFSERDRLVLI